MTKAFIEKIMRLLIFNLLAICLFSGCDTESTRPVNTGMGQETGADRLLASGQYFDAANKYLQLASLQPEKSNYFRLKAAEAYFTGGDSGNARAILENLRFQNDQEALNFEMKILLAKISLEDNSVKAALDALNIIPPITAPAESLKAFHETRAQVFDLQRNPISAAKERLALDRMLLSPVAKTNNNRQIWNAINQYNMRVLKRLRLNSTGLMTSWIELAIIYQSTLFEPELLQKEVAIWAEHYPNHPATLFLTEELLRSSRQQNLRPGHIALILPFSEPFEAHSKAIRDGFLTAWYSSVNYRPVVNIYNANSLDILEVYQSAVTNGADFIVGPLEKEAIKKLMDYGNLPVTTLALNQYDPGQSLGASDNSRSGLKTLIQFGLAPEDEAIQVADRASNDGHKKALVIAPVGDWGIRLFESFNQQWQVNGGKVIDFISYNNNINDFSTPVKRLLNVSSSEARSRLLQQKLSKGLKSESRLRQDADMIFLVADPGTSRQIVPQLRFHSANRFPVYSTSYLYSGNEAPELDTDINGVFFTDIPWVLKNENSVIRDIVDANWAADRSQYNRLYALGVDAYMIIPNLERLSQQQTISYSGNTGDLYMNSEGYIRRKSTWAQFQNGIPRLLKKDLP